MARRKKTTRCSCGMGALSRPSTGQRVVFDPGAGAEDRYRHEFVFPGMQGTVGEGSATGWTPAPYCNQERTLVEVHWDAGRTTCVPPRFLSLAREGRKGLGRKSGYTAEREHLPQIYLETWEEWSEAERHARGASAGNRRDAEERFNIQADRLERELEMIAERMSPEQFQQTRAKLKRLSVFLYHPGLGAPVRRPCSCPRKR